MYRVSVRDLFLFTVTAAVGCTSDVTPQEYADKHGCDSGWVDLCNDLNCNPESADWAGCAINGWKDKKPVLSCDPQTDWAGDELALCPPAADEGLQLHYGPSDYNDPNEIAKYTLDALVEKEDCFLINSENTESHYVNQYAGRMRPGSHHMILWGLTEDPAAPRTRGLGSCNGSATLGSSFYLGAQNLRIDIPDLSNKPDPVEEVSARPLPADQLFSIDMHYLNRTMEPVLRESWINMYYADPSLITKEAKAIFLVAPNINLPPHSTGTVVAGGCAAPKARSIRLLNGHFHQYGQRFSVYRKKVGAERELVYDSFNWADPYIAPYTGSAINPEPNRDLGISGGMSGPLQLAAGDSLEWECEMDNPADVTVRMGETGADQMCILFGMYIDDETDPSFNWNMASIAPGVPCLDSGRAGGISLN
jgi:hypothetical protein